MIDDFYLIIILFISFSLHFLCGFLVALGIRSQLATPDSRPAGHDDSEELCEFEEELAAFSP